MPTQFSFLHLGFGAVSQKKITLYFAGLAGIVKLIMDV